jgi:hypothetical protein
LVETLLLLLLELKRRASSKRCDYADNSTAVTTADEGLLAKVGIIRESA